MYAINIKWDTDGEAINLCMADILPLESERSMTDEERKQLEELTIKIEYLVREGVYITKEDEHVLHRALEALGQAHNAQMFQKEKPSHEWMEANIPY